MTDIPEWLRTPLANVKIAAMLKHSPENAALRRLADERLAEAIETRIALARQDERRGFPLTRKD